jgi:hypothetical protein
VVQREHVLQIARREVPSAHRDEVVANVLDLVGQAERGAVVFAWRDTLLVPGIALRTTRALDPREAGRVAAIGETDVALFERLREPTPGVEPVTCSELVWRALPAALRLAIGSPTHHLTPIMAEPPDQEALDTIEDHLTTIRLRFEEGGFPLVIAELNNLCEDPAEATDDVLRVALLAVELVFRDARAKHGDPFTLEELDAARKRLLEGDLPDLITPGHLERAEGGLGALDRVWRRPSDQAS